MRIKSQQERQELHGAEYVARFRNAQPQLRLERLIACLELPAGAVVADFGCGDAALYPHLRDAVSTYYGIDFSAPFIEAARERVGVDPKCQFFCGAIQDFCGTHPQSLDACFAFDLSEHVYDDEWLDILAAARQALKPGGRLFLHTPNARFFLEIMKERGILLKQFPEHVAVRDVRANEELIRRSGLVVTASECLAHYNVLKHLHPLSRLPLFGPYFAARLFIVAERR